MKRIILLAFLVLTLPKNTLGQYRLQTNGELERFSAIPKEEVFIHYNDNLLLSGEYLYYKFYCLRAENRAPSEISKIGYVELIGKDDELVFQHKIKLVDGLGQGDFFVPVDIATGHYKLTGFTQWMRNQGEQSFFIADLVIVNPYQALPKVNNQLLCEEIVHSKFDSLTNVSLFKEKTPSFRINLTQRKFGKRQLVKFDIEELIEQGSSNISISVRKKDSVKIPFQKKSSTIVKENSISVKKHRLKPNDSIYLPELRGELISGRIASRNLTQSIENRHITLSIAGDNGLTKVSRTNQNGDFYFNIDTGSRSSKAVFDILGDSENEIDIILDQTRISQDSFDFKELAISSDLNPSFEQRSIHNQIENAFFEQKADSIIAATYVKPAYKDFQKVYNLDEYTRFKTLQETIVEILEDVLVKKRKGKYTIQVRGSDEFFIDSYDAPLILVDNILVQDANALFDFGVKRMRRIGISRSEIYIGPKKYQGVFSVETKDGNYSETMAVKEPLIFDIKGPLAMRKYYEQEYSLSASNDTGHIADFRRQLLWLPQHKIKATETFEFFTSDNLGTYEISVEGFTENGKPISLLAQIQIE